MRISHDGLADFNEEPRQGYLNIYYADEAHHIELHVGVQSFKLDYSSEDYESAKWMAKQFAHALNRMVGDVELYGTVGLTPNSFLKSILLKPTKRSEQITNDTQNKQGPRTCKESLQVADNQTEPTKHDK